VLHDGARREAVYVAHRSKEAMNWWTWLIGAFLCGAFMGAVLMFIAVAEIARVAAKRDVAYTVRKDVAAKYWSEL